MTADDFPAFARCFNALALVMPDPNPDPTGLKIELYFETLQAWTLAEIEAAAAELRRSGGAFFPSVALWYEAVATERRRQQEAPYRSAFWGRQGALPPGESPAVLPPSPEEAKAILAGLKARFPATPRQSAVPRALVKVWDSDWKCPDCGIGVRDKEHKPDCHQVIQPKVVEA